MLLKTSSSSYLKYRTWTLTSAKNLDATCNLVQHGQGSVERRLGPGPGRRPDLLARPAPSPSPTRATSPARSVRPSRRSRCRPPAAPRRTPGPATGLPAGVTIGSSTGTVSGTPTTAGTYNVTVTATGSGGSGSRLDVVHLHRQRWRRRLLGPAAGQPRLRDRVRVTVDLLGRRGRQLRQPGRARAAAWKAWLDGYGSTHTDTLSQSVSIPSGCGATLSFYLHIDSAETTTSTAVRQADRQDRDDHAGDVLQPQQGGRLHVALVQRLGLRGPDGDDRLHRHRGLLAADVVRHRRHGAEPQLSPAP